MPVEHGPWRGLLFTALICGAAVGCESAHYVIRNPINGVVAIPEDTPEYRAQAEKLMRKQFPEGYIIDDVRVVALGRPYETVTRVGPYAEVEMHQRHETMLYYHAGQPVPKVQPAQLGAAPPRPVNPPRPINPPPPPASLAKQPTQENGLPPQPVPVE